MQTQFKAHYLCLRVNTCDTVMLQISLHMQHNLIFFIFFIKSLYFVIIHQTHAINIIPTQIKENIVLSCCCTEAHVAILSQMQLIV